MWQKSLDKTGADIQDAFVLGLVDNSKLHVTLKDPASVEATV